MARIPETCAPVNARTRFEEQLDEAEQSLCQTIGARLTALLVAIVSHVVSRGHYVRRTKVPKRLLREGKCWRCGSTRSRRFSRNGFRSREPLVMIWGEIPFEVPRVRWECGGSVKIDFAYHSDPGLTAMMAQVVRKFHDAQRPLQFPPKQIHYPELRA